MHDFRAPPWLPGGHAQTIWPVFFSRRYAGARPEKVRRLDTHSTAVHSVLERVRVFGPEGEAFAYVVATNVYVKATRGWRLVAHHASPGTASEVPEVAETASVLH